MCIYGKSIDVSDARRVLVFFVWYHTGKGLHLEKVLDEKGEGVGKCI